MSNREDFFEMREREAFENPQDYERPVESETISNPVEPISKLERRANAYLDKVSRNKYNKYKNVDFSKVKKRDFSDIDLNPIFHHNAKPLTDVQKLHYKSSSPIEKEVIDNISEGFSNLIKQMHE